MHQDSEHPEFMKTIKEIRDAEEEHDRLVNTAKERADRIMREAKERILEEHMRSEEEVVTFKNEMLRHGSKEIEAQVQKIIAHAKEEGAKTSKKKIEPQIVSKLVKDFLSNL